MIYKKDKTLQKKYLELLYIMQNYNFENEKIKYHFKKLVGNYARYQYISDVDYNNCIDILKTFKIEYKLGNDAPRGGKLGDYIEIDKKDLKVLKNKYKKEVEKLEKK